MITIAAAAIAPTMIPANAPGLSFPPLQCLSIPPAGGMQSDLVNILGGVKIIILVFSSFDSLKFFEKVKSSDLRKPLVLVKSSDLLKPLVLVKSSDWEKSLDSLK